MNIIRGAWTEITHTLFQGVFPMRGVYSSSSLFILGCFDAKGAGAGAQQGRHRSNDWQGRYHSPDMLYSHVKFSSFSYNVLRISFQFIIEKMVPAHLPKFSGCFLKEKDIATIKDEVGTHLQSTFKACLTSISLPSDSVHAILFVSLFSSTDRSDVGGESFGGRSLRC